MVILKTVPTAILVKVGKLPVKPLQFAIGISQIGEFSFVLGSLAFNQGALSIDQYTGVLVAVVISIMASTLLVRSVGATKR
jgi:CPA2 family monovalent cation:H+ antiporter-2